MDDKDIKKNLKERRRKAGLSQESMAEKLDMSRITYLHMESGDTKLINENLFKAAEVLDCKAEELVLGYTTSGMNDMKIKDLEQEIAELHEETVRLKAENEDLKMRCRMLQEQNDLKTEIITMLKSQKQDSAGK